MEALTQVRPPRWFRAVCWLALVWMIIGVVALVMDLTTDPGAMREQMTEAQIEIYANRPSWLMLVYGIAVFAGLAGAIALVLREAWAVPALTVSLVAIVIQFGYLIFGMQMVQRLGAAASLPFPLIIFCIGALLLWLAMHARGQGWIR
ncbi:MAG TPA: hypothetical protein VIL32_07310 [Steroidobacteraceae bacterium]